MSDGFEFEVRVDAGQWANYKRRVAFMEAVLARVLHENTNIREWFTAKELEVLKLPGLALNAAGITRKSVHQKWTRRKVRLEGRNVFAYHYTSLPNRAFEALLRRLIDLPDIENLIPEMVPQDKAPQVEPTPQWMLPLMRIIKNEPVQNWQDAYALLSAALPNNLPKPSPYEVERVFERAVK